MRLLFLSMMTALLCPDIAFGQWYAAIDLVVPTRRDSSNLVYARNQVTQSVLDDMGEPIPGEMETIVGTDILADIRDTQLNYETGGRILLGRRFDRFAIEGSYLETDHFTSGFALTDEGGSLASPFSGIGTIVDPVFDNNTDISVAFATEMETAEVNYLRLIESNAYGEGFFSIGVRYLAIDDVLQYSGTNVGLVSTRRLINTDNRLIGPQFGMYTHSPLKDGILHITLKATAAHNSIRELTTDNGGVAFSSTGDRNRYSALGSIRIEYEFPPIYFLSLRVGYEAMMASDVALAVDNFNADNPPPIAEDVAIVTEDVLYHIPYVGIVARY